MPWEPCWTWAGVSGSTSWQEPRPFLLVVNKGQSVLPPLQAPARWLLQRAGPAPVQFPAARPRCWRPVSVSLTHLRVEEGWSSRRCETRRSHTRARPAEVASSVSAWLLAFMLLVFRNRSAQAALATAASSCSRTLRQSSWPRALLPEVAPAAPGPSHPGTPLLFTLYASLLLQALSTQPLMEEMPLTLLGK